MAIAEVVVVTGASQGIGRAVARGLATPQRALVVTYRSQCENADRVVRELACCAADVQAVPLDVCDQASVDELMRGVEARYGRLDILVNNAGITADQTIAKMSDAQWQQVLDVNLTGAFRCSRAAIPLMLRAGRGRIIQIGSMSGHVPLFGQANYSASKAGLVGFSRGLAIELAAKNITVNVVSPGYITTELTDRIIPDVHRRRIVDAIPMRRFGRPEDVAEAVAFLAGGASYVTGSVIHVNGGLFC